MRIKVKDYKKIKMTNLRKNMRLKNNGKKKLELKSCICHGFMSEYHLEYLFIFLNNRFK